MAAITNRQNSGNATTAPKSVAAKKSARPQNAPADMTALMRTAVTEAEPGVALVAIRDSSVTPYVRMMTERAILKRTHLADLLMPNVNTVRALYGADSHDADFSEKLRRSTLPGKIGERFSCVRLAHCRRFSGLTNEGAHVVLEHLRDGECVTVQQAVMNVAPEELACVLGKLDNGAKERNGLIVVFLDWPQSEDTSWLHQHVREVILVDKCEPGPKASFAFSLTATSLESYHAWGVGRTMCEVSATAGRCNFTQEIFIATTALDRAIWYLYREREALSTIAWRVGLDKSTVSRRMNALPLPKDLATSEVDPYDGWREDWFPYVGLEVEPDEESGQSSSPSDREL